MIAEKGTAPKAARVAPQVLPVSGEDAGRRVKNLSDEEE